MKKITFLSLLSLLFTSFGYSQYLTEDFESSASLPAGWTLTQVNTVETWKLDANASAAHTGTNYALVEYDPTPGNQNETLTTSIIDLTSATNPRLVFWWNASYYWSVDPFDNYDFTVSVDDGSSVTQIFTETDEANFDSTDDNFVWFETIIDLSAYVGQNDIKIVFNYTGNDGASLSLDDVKVEETPTCFPPTSIASTPSSTTETDLTWTAGGSEMNWTYEYGVTGFTQGGGTTDTAVTNSANLSSLTPGETYDIYFQSNCGGSDGDSVWSGVFSWTQPLPPPANDNPSTAISLTVDLGTSCGANTITGITNAGSTDSGVTTPSCGSYGTPTTRGDLWYTVVAPSTGAITLNVGNLNGFTSIAGAFYSGTVGSLVEESCTEFASGWPWNVSGLNPGETYYVRVWDYGNDQEGTFDLCAYYLPPIVPNHLTDFENYPDGWSEASGAYGSPSGNTSDFTSKSFGNDAGNSNGASAIVNIYGTLTDEYLISPVFNLSGATYYLNFDLALTEYNDTTSATLGSDDYLALLVTENEGLNWIELARWDSSSTISNTGQAVAETVLSGYGGNVQFAFYAFSDTSNEDNDLFIDNFQITTTTLGVDENRIEGFKLYPTVVKDELSFSSLENVDQMDVYNLLGQKVFTSQPNTSNSFVDLSPLKGGIYLVKVKVGTSTGTYKIIKE